MSRAKPKRRGVHHPPPAEARLRRPPVTLVLAVAGLVLIHFTLAVTSVLHKSNTYDEIAHFTRGFSYRLMSDFRLGPPHPPLAHYWASLPVRLGEVQFPRRDQDAWYTSNMWAIGQQFFYYNNMGNAARIDGMLLRGRAMIAIWSAALGLLVFYWGRRLFGDAGGLIALSLYAFSPTMLAHGRLVTTDCPAALFFLCSLTAIWWLLHRVSPASVLAGAASLTCLFLAKMSAVLIIPVGLVLLAVRIWDSRPLLVRFGRRSWEIHKRAAMLGAFLAVMLVWIGVVWTGIWAAYGFRYAAMVDAQPERDRFYTSGRLPEGRDVWDYELRGLDRLRPVVTWLRGHRLLPEAYLYCAVASSQTARGRNAFLNGAVSIRGFVGFFPYTFLVKTPLPLLLLLVLAASWPLLRRRVVASAGENGSGAGQVRAFLYATAPLTVFFVAYWLVSLRSHLNIGHRHVLPTYPVLFVMCGATAGYLRARSKRLRFAVPVLLAALGAASLRAYPHYLAYFNVLAGGPDGAHKHLVDSSLDWGQDLPGLAKYLERRRGGGFSGDTYVSYFGSGGTPALAHFGIDATPLPAPVSADATGTYALGPGLYAISATNLAQVYLNPGDHRWTEELEARYRRLLPAYEAFAAAPNTPEGRARWATASFRDALGQFQRLRFARLCAYLRQRRPDEIVNHTIMIYELDAPELAAALTGPVETADSPDR